MKNKEKRDNPKQTHQTRRRPYRHSHKENPTRPYTQKKKKGKKKNTYKKAVKVSTKKAYNPTSGIIYCSEIWVESPSKNPARSSFFTSTTVASKLSILIRAWVLLATC